MASMASITKQGSQTPIMTAVQGDHNTKHFTFVVQRYDGEVDLSPLVWMIEIKNAEGNTDGTALVTYLTEENIQLTWMCGGIATAAEGRTSLQVCGFDGERVKQWNSGLYYMEVKRKLQPDDKQREAVSQLQELIQTTVNDARDTIRNMEQVAAKAETVANLTAEAQTLPAGSQATAEYANGVLRLGIPQGESGSGAGSSGKDGTGIVSISIVEV